MTEDGELWVSLIEKAFAKMCTNYAATEQGYASWGMTYLCGQQGEQWELQDDGDCWVKQTTCWDEDETGRESEGFMFSESTKDHNQLWAALLKYTSRNFPMCCSVYVEQEGLIGGHAYSLLMAREVRARNGKTLKLLKIRNPHGNSEWTGNWSDQSSKWQTYPAVARKLGFVAVDLSLIHI